MISVCVAYRQDPYIQQTIYSLCYNATEEFEIIIVDDASEFPLREDLFDFPVRIIRNHTQRGVGRAFDIAVKEAKGDIIILSGSDVITTDPDWMGKVKEYVTAYPNGIGCSTCLSGDRTHFTPDNLADDVKRYGARLYPIVTSDDLSSDSPLLEGTSQYVVDMFNGRWHKKRPEENVNEVACLMGAWYCTTKEWYNHIGGWDNLHSYWGGLESWVSIKSWLMGGYIHNIRDLETIHVFHKYETPANGRSADAWFNKFAVAYSQLPMDVAKRMIDKVYDMRVQYELHTLPFNLGKNLLRERWSRVMEVRERNTSLFIRDWDWYCDKFNIKEI